jgi:transcription initiation factor TFIIIB Brf1 subunit/transcription initiation factor TFIIB
VLGQHSKVLICSVPKACSDVRAAFLTTMADHQRPDVCHHCKAVDTYDLEDVDGSQKYVCTDCGTVLDEVVLVSYGEYNEDGREELYGTYVAADDDGTRAGEAVNLMQEQEQQQEQQEQQQRMAAAQNAP